MIRTDGPGCSRWSAQIEYALIAALGVPFLMLMIAAICRQHRCSTGWCFRPRR